MSLEGLNETKNDLKQQYMNEIKKLALQKMKNYILFEEILQATIRKFSSLGLDVSRESILKDIQNEIYLQNQGYNLNVDEILQDLPTIVANNQQVREPVDYQSDIDQLKNNLGSIFETSPTEDLEPVDISRPIPPREPAIEPVWGAEDIRAANLRQLREMQERKEETPIHTEQEKEKIREDMQRAQEEIKQKLEWAKQQPNKPTMTFTGNLEKLSDDVKKRIIQQMESRGEVIISSIDNIYQEGNYIIVDAKDNQGRFTGTEFTLDDFTKIVNQPSTITKTEKVLQQPTDNITESLVQEQPRVENTQPKPEPIQEHPQQISQNESEKDFQEQQTKMKNQIISQIMAGMNKAGEFSFGDISMSERMNIMQNVQNKLNAKSFEELQMLLSTYQEQNVQEEKTMGMHK